LGVTMFGIFLTPVFFYVIQWLGDRRGMDPGPIGGAGSPVARPGPKVESGLHPGANPT
jgi:multidrug efflux pump